MELAPRLRAAAAIWRPQFVGGLFIDEQLKLERLLYRQVSRLFRGKYFCNIAGRAPLHVGKAGPIRQKGPVLEVKAAPTPSVALTPIARLSYPVALSFASKVLTRSISSSLIS